MHMISLCEVIRVAKKKRQLNLMSWALLFFMRVLQLFF